MRNRKTLEELVADRSFVARRHQERLLEPPLERADLRKLQLRYKAATAKCREIAVDFERTVKSDSISFVSEDVERIADGLTNFEQSDEVVELEQFVEGLKRQLASRLSADERVSASEILALSTLELRLSNLRIPEAREMTRHRASRNSRLQPRRAR